MSEQDNRGGAFVEFVVRIHESGKRERHATVYITDERGVAWRAENAPTGELGRFVARAVGEIIDPPKRRVAIDSPDVAASRREGRRFR